MQIKVHVRCNSELATLFSALFGDEPRETQPSKFFLDRRSLLRELDKIVFPRLFGPGAWPAKDKELDALHGELLRLGLTQPVPGEPDMVRVTRLGQDLDLDVLMVFFGLYTEDDMLGKLVDLVDDEMDAYFMEHIEENDVLKVVGREAYMRYRSNLEVPPDANAAILEDDTSNDRPKLFRGRQIVVYDLGPALAPRMKRSELERRISPGVAEVQGRGRRQQ